MRLGDDERGSAPAEFAMVGGLLTVLLLAVVQFAVVLLVRNTVLDAAQQGARVAAFADGTPQRGAERTRELIAAAVGPGYARHVTAQYTVEQGIRVVEVRVATPLPLIGLVGVADALEVRGHAASAAG